MPKLVKVNIGKKRFPKTKDGNDFRIICWNTEDHRERGPFEGDQEKVTKMLNEVRAHSNNKGANVICLQELHWSTFDILESRLKNINKRWNCFFDWKERYRDKKLFRKITPITKLYDVYGLAICVLGRGSNFKRNYFTETNGKPWLDKERGARSYTQIDYKGVRITCVHTQAWHKRNTLHITELHKKGN